MNMYYRLIETKQKQNKNVYMEFSNFLHNFIIKLH